MNTLVRFSVRSGKGRGVRSENLTVRKMLSLAQSAYLKVSFIKNILSSILYLADDRLPKIFLKTFK